MNVIRLCSGVNCIIGVGVTSNFGIGLTSGVGVGTGLTSGVGISLTSGVGIGVGMGVTSGVGIDLISGVGMGVASGIGVDLTSGVGAGTFSTGGTIGTSIGLAVKKMVEVVQMMATAITAIIPNKTRSDKLLDTLEGKNKRNVLKNQFNEESTHCKKVVFLPVLAGCVASSLTTVVCKAPIVPLRMLIIIRFQIG